MAKTLYHSELQRVCAEPTEITVTSDVIASKFKAGTFCVMVTLAGVERTYNCENQACADAFAGLKGQSIVITAAGSREDATIEVDADSVAPAAGTPLGAAKPAAAKSAPIVKEPPAPEPAPAPAPAVAAKADDKFHECGIHLTRIRNSYIMSVRAMRSAHLALEAETGIGLDAGQQQACASSLFIQFCRDNWHHQMPTRMPASPETK